MALLNDDGLKNLLLQGGFLSQEELERAELHAKKTSLSLESSLIDLDLVTDDNLGQLLASEFDVPYVKLTAKAIDPSLMKMVSLAFAKQNHLMPFQINEEGLFVAMHDPKNLHLVQMLEKRVGRPVHVSFATLNDLNQSHNLYRQNMGEEIETMANSIINAKERIKDDSELIKVVDLLVDFAYTSKASDMHVEPHESKTVVRFRIDGVLKDVVSLPEELHDRLLTRMKILGHLRTDEHFAAQDGHIKYSYDKESVDIRISILPTTFGEKAVLRLLSEKARQFSLDEIGLSQANTDLLKSEAKKPWGMILVTGPTGSGKTTTLYAVLKLLNSREINISTIEDPVEYSIEGVNQIQVNRQTDLSFAQGLRSIVRQDPDVIMVGEIRDEETADISVNAALTGHLLLSTLHTNDAATALPRLVDMGMEPFLVASTVNVVIAQRLLRKICPNCIHSHSVTEAELVEKGYVIPKAMKERLFQTGTANVYHGEGCQVCHHSGYLGRTGVYEILIVNGDTRRMVLECASSDLIRQAAISNGMITMFEDGLEKILLGKTTIEELLRIVRE